MNGRLLWAVRDGSESRGVAARIGLAVWILCAAFAFADGPADALWPTYHGAYDLTGAVAAGVPDEPVVLWRFRADDAISQPLVVGGGRIFFASGRGTVYAVDMAGTQVWSRAFGDATNAVTFSAPVYAEGSIVLGSSAGRLYALDGGNGATAWEYDVGMGIMGAPNAIAPDGSNAWRVIVISQGDGTLHCVSLATGKGLWKSEKTNRCDGSPGVGDNRIVYGNCDSALYVFSAADGGKLGKLPLCPDCQVAGGVAIAGNHAFSGSRGGTVYCADVANVTMVWTNAAIGNEVFATPAVGAKLVVVVSGGGRMAALDRQTGELKWHYDAGGPGKSAVIAGDRAVATAGGKLYVLALDSGAVLSSTPVSDSITSPALAGGVILVGGEDGMLTAFGAAK